VGAVSSTVWQSLSTITEKVTATFFEMRLVRQQTGKSWLNFGSDLEHILDL